MVLLGTEIGIPSSGSTYYYFEVMLAEPVSFTTLDREAIATMDPTTVSLAEVLGATKEYTIDGWAMPDPRNLQIVDRGIIDALFTPDLSRVITDILTSPRVSNIIQKALSGQRVNINDFLSAATPKQQNRIQSILARNANSITTKFETAFDPMLASVFTVPRVNPQSESLWVASIDSIADGDYYLSATVYDAAGNPADQVQEMFTVDTSAPEAGIRIMPGDANVTGYTNAEGIYVATALDPGAAGTLNIMGMPKGADVGAGKGYLFYQEIALDADGNPESSWMPLTVGSTMLTSRIWSAVLARVPENQLASFAKQNFPQLVGGLDGAAIAGLLSTTTPETILALLTPDLIQAYANPFLKGLEPYIGRFQLTQAQSELIVNALGASLDIVDHLVPVTFDASDHVTMPLIIGDYGIRAMGIDTLFNVGSYTEPTRVRIVMPEYDMASVTAAVIGDCNLDGDMDDLFESGPIGDVTIFKNTTDNVVLTVTVDNRTAHPAIVMVQYMDAAGAWQNISELDLAGTETGSTLEIGWNVADFDALVGAGATVMVRAVATNALQLTDPNPMAGAINLDAGICPLDPEVVAIIADPPTATNSDSGGPQGTRTLSAYTPSRTSTPISSLRLAAKGPQDAEWIIETSGAVEHIEGQELAGILGDLVNTVGPDKPIVHINSTYQKWMVSVDTTTLEDTITADSPAARDASKDENQYVVTGYANTNGIEVPPIPGVQEMLSVDNIDDVAPLGPTNISVKGVEGVDSVFETAEDGSYTVGGLVDKYDEAVASPVATFTIEPIADRNTYQWVRLVTDAEGLLIGDVTETAEGSGVFEVTVDVGTLADGETYLENGTYMFHALAFDEFNNEQVDESDTDGSKISVAVENTYRPDPEVLAITTDPAAETNPDSGGPQGTLTLSAYTPSRASTPISSVRLVAKGPQDAEWVIEASDAVEHIDGQELADILGDLVNTVGPDKPIVHINSTYQKWMVSVDTTTLEDTITADSPAARDASKDENQYVVTGYANTNGTEVPPIPGVQEMFSVDNVDDVAPLGPTNISVKGVEGVDSVFETAEDGSYTVGGLVDKYDEAVASPVAAFTIEPIADRNTYKSVRLVTDAEGLLIGDVTETAEGSGVFEVTVDVGTLADGETYLENGTYMFHALAFDEFNNEQVDESDTDGSKISVAVETLIDQTPKFWR